MFDYALNKLISKHPGLTSSRILRVEEQVVSGMNYRFTFRNSRGQTVQETIYVPIGFKNEEKESSTDGTAGKHNLLTKSVQQNPSNSGSDNWPNLIQLFSEDQA